MKTNCSSGSLLKAIDLVREQIQRIAIQDLRQIEFPDDIFLPPELHRLVANVNDLIDQTFREKASRDAVMQSEKK